MLELDMNVVMKKGAVITCEEGHYICKVTKDIKIGEEISLSVFGSFGEAHLKPIDKDFMSDIKCGLCGANWISSNGKGEVYLHSEGVWV